MSYCVGISSRLVEYVAKFDARVTGWTLSDFEAQSPLDLKKVIRESELANLVVPVEFCGKGLGLNDLLEILYYVSRRSPSIGVMLCMHYHVVAALSAFPEFFESGKLLLQDVGKENKLVASAFAEGVPGRDIFTSTVMASVDGETVVLNGSKKPCTMSSIADYYAVSIATDDGKAGLALVKSGAEGISYKKFWPSKLLQAADSNQVIFENVRVDVSYACIADEAEIAPVLSFGLAGFNLMVNAAYTGVSSVLAEKLSADGRVSKGTYIEIYGKILQSFYSSIGLSSRLSDLPSLECTLNSVLILRFRNQKTIKEITALVNENISSYKFLSDPEVASLGAICNLMTFHPISQYQYENAG